VFRTRFETTETNRSVSKQTDKNEKETQTNPDGVPDLDTNHILSKFGIKCLAEAAPQK
jgi:hypothetical protein